MTEIKETGIYIHYPFCVRKCFYCDFYSVTDTSLEVKYLEYLAKEMDIFFNKYKVLPDVPTLFIGGGTPSLMAPGQLAGVLAHLRQYVLLLPGAEITVECNPGTNIAHYLQEYRQLGVNRLSVGVQSFNDDELTFLHRIHNSAGAVQTIEAAREAGFDNVSIDLIFSLPGQTEEKLKQSLDRALETGVDHISAYSLIYEEGTPLYESWSKGQVEKNEDEPEAALYLFLIEELRRRGYEQYEVSNFARQGRKCIHNINYWRAAPYISFGPSAHSYLDGRRFANVKNIHEYFTIIDREELPVNFEETLGKHEMMTERVFLSLRSEGLNVDQFHREFGVNPQVTCSVEIEELIGLGMMQNEAGTLRLLPRGYAVCDEICLRLIGKIEKLL